LRKGVSGNERSRLSATETLLGDSGWDPSAMKMTEIKREEPSSSPSMSPSPAPPTIKVETVDEDRHIKQEAEEL
jgi:hypothetical protein